MKIFISNLQRVMESKKLDVAELASQCGLTENDINDFLNEKRSPRPSELAKMAKKLKLPFESLLYPVAGIPAGFECKLLALDVDGVMTDGGMIVSSNLTETKKFNTRDGLAIKVALRRGVEVGFISNGKNIDLIGYRAEMLDVKRIYVGTERKLPVLESWCEELGITMQQVAYIGDDINDLDIIRRVGLGACPADAAPAVKADAKIVLQTRGGKGCIRELGDIMGWTE